MSNEPEGADLVGRGIQRVGGGCFGIGCSLVFLFGILATVWGMLMMHLEGLAK